MVQSRPMNLGSSLTIKIVPSIAEIPAGDWNRCAHWAGPPGADGIEGADPRNPFISHAFLSALEDSGSVGARTGWTSAHLVAADAGGAIVGVVPAYLKSHSQGEYVFDHAWADAFQRAGGRYYPKIQATAPFTPATGRRLLAAPGPGAEAVERAMAEGLVSLREQINASSAHVTFQPEPEWERMDQGEWLRRCDVQYHWFNRGYAAYEDFLGALASRKRKALKRERRDAVSANIVIERLTGPELTEAIWDEFFAFYLDTGSRKWGQPYLTRAFFSLIGERMSDQIILVMAKREGQYIAGAINFLGAKALYGRHWGCREDHPFLHFEVCYHQAIEHAIGLGLIRVEAGAQGDHKLARGYEPVLTRSSHAIANPGFRRAVANFLKHETKQVRTLVDQMAEETPYARPDAEA